MAEMGDIMMCVSFFLFLSTLYIIHHVVDKRGNGNNMAQYFATISKSYFSIQILLILLVILMNSHKKF